MAPETRVLRLAELAHPLPLNIERLARPRIFETVADVAAGLGWNVPGTGCSTDKKTICRVVVVRAVDIDLGFGFLDVARLVGVVPLAHLLLLNIEVLALLRIFVSGADVAAGPGRNVPGTGC